MVARRTRDDGVSLIEVLVAIALVGVVMTAVTSFFVRTLAATNQQRGKQVATHLADSAMERVRALKGSTVADGRRALTECALGCTGTPVVPLPGGTQWRNLEVSGSTPLLPTAPETVTVAGADYQRYWYVGECWMPSGVLSELRAVNSAPLECTAPKPTGAVAMFRIVVAVTWSDRACTGGTCTYATSSLVSAEAQEPIFNENETTPWPTIENPGNLTDFVGLDITPTPRTFTTSGGVPSVRVSGTGIPDGLTLSPDGKVTGKPTKAGAYQVVLTVTDSRDRIGTTSFLWTIKSVVTLTSPGTQTTALGVPVNLQIADAGPGEAPLTWSLTGTPPTGITFNALTGTFSGTPTVSGQSVSLTVSARDKNYAVTKNRVSSVTFTWTAIADWYVATVNNKSTAHNSDASTEAAVTAVGGLAPYTWTATGLPNGVTLDLFTGKFAGKPTKKGIHVVTVTATDGRLPSAQTRTRQFTWTVT